MAAMVLLSMLPLHGQVNVLTWHNDLARTGQNLNETVLKPSNVNPANFGKVFTFAVDGDIYTQPLYMANVTMPDHNVHNVIFVATEHDSVYAFDADGKSTTPLWHDSFINAARGVRPVSASADAHCGDLVPEIGITGTPVIDPATGTLYLVAATTENAKIVDRLHALDVSTGAEKFGGPVVIQASVPGTGGASVGGRVPFDPAHAMQRPGLLLLHGAVVVAFASYCDNGTYHGWALSYDAQTLGLQYAFTPTPNSTSGGIWQGGVAPASDGNSIFLSTGNGGFNANTGGTEYGDSVLRLTQQLQVADSFTPYNQANLDQYDLDVASAGLFLLPDQSGSHPHLLVASSKAGTLYLIDRDAMGGFHAGSDSQIVDSVPNAFRSVFGGFAYWNQTVYGAGVYRWNGATDVPKAFAVQQNKLVLASQAATPFGYPGATPSISANGNRQGILWAVQTDQYGTGPAVLHAYDATNLATELYNSSQTGSRDQMGVAVKFAVPTIANGRVYVGARDEVDVFGLLGAPPPPTPDFSLALTPSSSTVNAGSNASLTLNTTALNGDTAAVTLTCTAPASGCTISPATLAPGQSASVSIAAGALSSGDNPVTVSASDGVNTHTATATVTVGASGLPVPAISNLTATGVTLSWTTAQALNTQAWYGVSSPSTHADNWALTTQHSITLTGLQPNTTYQVQTESSWFTNPDLTSPVFTVTTTAATPPPAPDFTVALAPATSTVAANTNATLTLNSSAVNGDTAVLTLTCTAPASGCTVNPATLAPGQSASVSIAASALSSGANPVTVSATDGSNTHTAAASVTVTPAPAPDFTVALAPATSTVAANTNATLTLSSSALNGDTSPLTLTCTAPASGCTVSPATLTPGQSAAVSIAASALVSGANPVTVSASDGVNTHTAAASVTVSPASGLALPTISGISSSGFTLTWTTTQALNTQVWYGVSQPATQAYNWALTTQHVLTVTGLAPNTTYQVMTESSYFTNPDLTSPVFTVTTLAATAPPDFTVALAPATSSVGPATAATLTLATTALNGDTNPLTLSCTAPASGCTFSPATITPGQSAAVSIAASALTSGDNAVTVSASDGTYTHTAAATVTVTATAPPDFTLTLLPATSTVASGANASLTLTSTALGGDSNPLTLSCIAPASGCTVSPATIAPGQSATVSISASALSSGANPITLSGSDGVNTHTAAAVVNVSGSSAGLPLPTVTQLGSTSVTLTWTTSQALNTQVWYGVSQPSTHAFNWALVTQHSLTLTGLQPNTTYFVQTESSWFTNPDLRSDVFTITTTP